MIRGRIGGSIHEALIDISVRKGRGDPRDVPNSESSTWKGGGQAGKDALSLEGYFKKG